MVNILDLSEFLMAKLCHDLAGPVGAVNNGIELLKDQNPALHKQSVELIELSAGEALARLLYFRQAYGPTRNNAEISLQNIINLINDFYKNKNLKFIWQEINKQPDSATLIKNDVAKLILNIMLIVADSLIHGGVITITIQRRNDNHSFKIRGEGKAVKVQEYIAKYLATNLQEAEIESKNAHACLTKMLAQKFNEALKVESSDDFIEIALG